MNVICEIKIARERIIYQLTSDINSFGRNCYGITVSTTLFGREETASVADISTEIDEVQQLMFILADNTVLPSTLQEIVSDYIASVYTV